MSGTIASIREIEYRKLYGEFMTSEDVATVFSYPGKEAVKKAALRGTLPVKLFKISGRKQLFASTTEVARTVDTLCGFLNPTETVQDTSIQLETKQHKSLAGQTKRRRNSMKT
jgi:hypothetical protein